MKVDFCLPARNEEKILEQNVKRLKKFLEARTWPFSWQITIMVNGSSDGSFNIAKELQDNKVAARQIMKPGKGLALKNCFVMSSSDILVFADVDLSVSLDNIPNLILPLIENDSDLVIGSRLLPESTTNRSFLRDVSSRLYNALSRLILLHSLSDLQCGFKAIKKTVFTKVEPFLRDDCWFFDTELVIFTERLGYRVKEIAVDWQENRYEERKSKVNILKDGLIFIKRLLELRIRLRTISK